MPEAGFEVHQFTPVLLPRDGVGVHVLECERALREGGIEGRLWALAIHPELNGRGALYGGFEPPPSTDRLLVYQAASKGGELVDFLLARREKKTIYYHNLTPAHFYDPYDAGIARTQRAAEAELRRFVEHVDVGMAVSEFNAAGLRDLGLKKVLVVPCYLPPRLHLANGDRAARGPKARQGLEILFVGRMVPHKGQLNLVRLVAALRAGVDPNAHAVLVGPPGPELYVRAVEKLAEQLAPGAISFAGSVPDEQMASRYATADVFVCLSEHEGFCIPIVEAMLAGLPVVAYAAGAVPETLGGAGILVNTTDPIVLAETVARLVDDETVRNEVCRRQLERARDLQRIPRDRMLLDAVRRILG